MIDIDTQEPSPPNPSFEKFWSFMTRMQERVDAHVRSLHVPLKALSNEELVEFVHRLNSYLEFELSSDNIESGMPVCVKGSGLLIASDKEGYDTGSEIVAEDDVVIGSVSSVSVRTVPTFDAVVEAQGSQSTGDSHDFMLSVAAILEDSLFCVGLDVHGNPSHQHDLSGYNVHLAIAYPLKFSPIAIQQ